MTPYTPPPSRITCAWLAVMLVYVASTPFFQPALAQSDNVPSATQTVAITNTRVVQAPGQILESATVVIRDGLIDAVGSIEPPFDARIIAGDSLTVYAGFIDGLSHTAVDTPDDDPEEGSFAEQGIRPQRAVRPLLKPGDASKLREAGFGLAHVAPEGQMLPGEGALILLAGDTPDQMILTDRASLFAQMEGAEGSWPNVVKPSTPMAVISQMRDLVREARRRMMLAEAYENNPSGRSRPPSDAVHSAFFPVLDGKIPILFYAEDVLDTHRILGMADELDLPIMLAGVPDAFEALDGLQASGAPLFLTLDLPKPADGIEADTTDADSTQRAITPQDPGSFFESDLRVRSEEDTEKETAQLKARQRAILDQYRGTAATLHNAGMTFGFSSLNAKPGDIHDNLRAMIEAGLPKDAALAALTTDAASLLGVSDQVGTVEEGKIANLIVTSGDLFDEDTGIEHVFVDGHRFDYTAKEEEGEVTGSVEAVLGTWSYDVETPQGSQSGTIVIEGDASSLEGTISGAGESEAQDIEAVSFDGTTLSFIINSPEMGQLNVSVGVEGTTFDGSVSGPFGSLPITGEKESPEVQR